MRTESNIASILKGFVTLIPSGTALKNKENKQLVFFQQTNEPSPHFHVSGPTDDQLSWLLSPSDARCRTEMVKRREIAKFMHLDRIIQRISRDVYPHNPQFDVTPGAFGIDPSKSEQDLDAIVSQTREVILNKALGLDTLCFNRLMEELEKKNFLQLKSDLLFLKRTQSQVWELSTMHLALSLDNLHSAYKELFDPLDILGLSDHCTAGLTQVFLQFEKTKQCLMSFVDQIHKASFVTPGDNLSQVIKNPGERTLLVKKLELAEKNTVHELKVLENCLHKTKEVYFKERLVKFKGLLKKTHKSNDAYDDAYRWYVNARQFSRKVPIDCSLLSEMSSLEKALNGKLEKHQPQQNIWVNNIQAFEKLLNRTQHLVQDSTFVKEAEAWIKRSQDYIKIHPESPLPSEFRSELHYFRQKLQELA